MKKVRDKPNPARLASRNQISSLLTWAFGMSSSRSLSAVSVVLQLIIIVLVILPNSYSTTLLEDARALSIMPVSSDALLTHSRPRVKRQIFRQTIPTDRPLTGNVYAEHHGFPHPGRWHERPQSVKPPNPNSGHHFQNQNQNVIITDEDFKRYGSTLQHIDEMIYQQRLREMPYLFKQQEHHQEPPQHLDLNLVQQHPPPPQHHSQLQVPFNYGPPPAPPTPPISVQYLPPAPQYSVPPPAHPPPPPPELTGPFQPSYFPPPHPHQQHHPPQHNFLSNHPGVEHGQIHLVPHSNHISGPAPVPPSASYGVPPETEIVHHRDPNPVIPVVAQFHYNHDLGEVKGQRTVKYLPGQHTTHGSPLAPPQPSPQYGAELRPQYGPVPSPQYGAELGLPQYNVLGPEDDIHSSGPGPTFYGPPPPPPQPVHAPKPIKVRHHHQDSSFNRIKGPSSYSFRRPKQHGHYSNSNSHGGYLPARRPVRYSLRTPGSYSWSVSY